MIEADIYDAFCSLLNTFAANQSPPLRVSYPGIPFDPGSDDVWLALRHFPNRSINYGIENDGPTLVQGFFQVTIYQRNGGGVMASLMAVNDLVTAFPKGTKLVDSTNLIKIPVRPFLSAVLESEEGDSSNHFVTIPYSGFV